MELILDLLYIFVAAYTLYFLALSIRSLNDHIFKNELRRSVHDEKENLAVVVYAHNNKKSLERLISELKSQSYPDNKYRVFVLLDNCSDDSQSLFVEENFIHVIDIKGVGTIGKDQAVATLLEKLSDNNFIDAYVFLDADRSVDSGFLAIVNAAIKREAVISGETIIEIDSLGVVDKIKAAYQKYHMNFLRKARSLFGLAAMADSGVFIIRRSIVDEIGDVDFKDINSELKYSLLLSKIKCRCTFNPNIQTLVNPINYVFRKPRLSYRLDLFKNCVPQLFSTNFVFTEHICSLLYPNIWLLLIIYAGLFKHSLSYHFLVDVKLVSLSFVVLILAFGISLINAKMTLEEIGYLCVYPIYSMCHIIKNLPPIRYVVNKLFNSDEENANVEKFTVDAIITTAKKNNLNYKLEFISVNGMAKVRLIRKNKHYVTSSHLRMIDALQELKLILDDHGAILRICSCCSHFKPCVDGSTNMLRGFCDSQYPSPSINNEPRQTVVWNTCSAFSPAKLNSLINELIQSTKEENEKKEEALYNK